MPHTLKYSWILVVCQNIFLPDLFFSLWKKWAWIEFFLDKKHYLVPDENWTENDNYWNSNSTSEILVNSSEAKTLNILGKFVGVLWDWSKLAATPYLCFNPWDQEISLLFLKLKVVWLPRLLSTITKEICSIVPGSCWMKVYFFSKRFYNLSSSDYGKICPIWCQVLR